MEFGPIFLSVTNKGARDFTAHTGTKVTEYTGVAETATIASGARVVGLRAGATGNWRSMTNAPR
ncbi:MAG: hypothetical protein HRU33_23605 [Rhodobacteraceae bacterium]|nr:hypothetical protein [Paracoccaceae bacterium]